ncbi:MAG: 50S ribosomal protein L4 [Gammaproteobacteria bacterium]|nr:50S ribosomal protein L4 [Gammaproteobacteria bacterium]
MQVAVVQASGKPAGTGTEISDRTFGVDFREPLVHQAVTAYLAGGRQGTRAQKNRSDVRGGGAKPWRQKGTGRARIGTIRAPQWRGGGVVFPARTRDFSQKLNKKMYRAAMRCILSQLVREERLVVIDDIGIDAFSTKAVSQLLGALQMKDVLVVTDAFHEKLAFSARNLPGVEVCDVAAANPVNLIRREKVLMTVAAVKKFEELLG